MANGRLTVLAGPSCVGKSPLDKALARFHPDLRAPLRSVVLYNDREPRPGEVDGVDYHFRGRDFIRELEQAGDHLVMDVRGDLQALDVAESKRNLDAGDVFFEGNPFVGHSLLKDLENIETRAGSAFRELKMAHEFDAVLPNHDGEDSDNWDAFYFPLGDARHSLNAFVALLKGEDPDFAETWEAGLLP